MLVQQLDALAAGHVAIRAGSTTTVAELQLPVNVDGRHDGEWTALSPSSELCAAATWCSRTATGTCVTWGGAADLQRSLGAHGAPPTCRTHEFMWSASGRWLACIYKKAGPGRIAVQVFDLQQHRWLPAHCVTPQRDLYSTSQPPQFSPAETLAAARVSNLQEGQSWRTRVLVFGVQEHSCLSLGFRKVEKFLWLPDCPASPLVLSESCLHMLQLAFGQNSQLQVQRRITAPAEGRSMALLPDRGAVLVLRSLSTCTTQSRWCSSAPGARLRQDCQQTRLLRLWRAANEC